MDRFLRIAACLVAACVLGGCSNVASAGIFSRFGHRNNNHRSYNYHRNHGYNYGYNYGYGRNYGYNYGYNYYQPQVIVVPAPVAVAPPIVQQVIPPGQAAAVAPAPAASAPAYSAPPAYGDAASAGPPASPPMPSAGLSDKEIEAALAAGKTLELKLVDGKAIVTEKKASR